VNNLSWRPENDLTDFFERNGCKLRPGEEAVRISFDRETGCGRAHVDFEDAESLKIALTLNNKDLDGREVHIDVAERPPRMITGAELVVIDSTLLVITGIGESLRKRRKKQRDRKKKGWRRKSQKRS